MEQYSNALGYGFWCGKKCAQRKMAAGIPPLGSGRATKSQEAANDAKLAQAALEAQRAPQQGMSALALTGVIGASLLGIALMVVIIRRSKKK